MEGRFLEASQVMVKVVLGLVRGELVWSSDGSDCCFSGWDFIQHNPSVGLYFFFIAAARFYKKIQLKQRDLRHLAKCYKCCPISPFPPNIARLISIISKPIKVVFVVVVVFVKKIRSTQCLDPKTMHVQKTLGLKKLDSKKFWVKKSQVPESFGPKN